MLMKFLALPNSTNRLSRLSRNDVLAQQFNKNLSGRVKPRGFSGLHRGVKGSGVNRCG